MIANLTKEGELNARLTVEVGRGYQPALTRISEKGAKRSVGSLLLDASFSPSQTRQLPGGKYPG